MIQISLIWELLVVGLNPWSDMSTDRMFDTATGSTRAWSIHSRNETNSETVEPLKITVAPRPSSTIKLRENYTAEFDATTTTTEVIAAAIEETSAESASGTNRIRNPDDEAEIVQLPEFTDGPDDLAGYEIVNVPATDMEPANTITVSWLNTRCLLSSRSAKDMAAQNCDYGKAAVCWTSTVPLLRGTRVAKLMFRKVKLSILYRCYQSKRAA